MAECQVCGEDDWDKGVIEMGWFPQRWWAGNNILYHSKTKKLSEKKVPLLAGVCLSCGNVQVFVEPGWLPKKRK
jgi:hypothetical protein